MPHYSPDLLKLLKGKPIEDAAEQVASDVKEPNPDFNCPSREELDGMGAHEDFKLAKHTKRVMSWIAYAIGLGLCGAILSIFYLICEFIVGLAGDAARTERLLLGVFEYILVACAAIFGQNFLKKRFGSKSKE